MKRVLLVACVAVLLVGGAAAASFVYRLDHRVEGQYFDAQGVRIHYTVDGAGPPVVLVHGFAANGDLNWRSPGMVEALAAHYQVITLDNRGHGLSDKPHTADAYGMKMVEDVVRLLDHLEIPRAHVVGYSMGGFITLKLLTTYPERLLSAAPCAAGWSTPEENHALLENLAVSLEQGQGFAPLTQAITPGNNPGRFRVWFTDRILNHLNDQQALGQVVRGFKEFEVPEEALRENKVPVLSVVGSLDPLKVGIDNMEGILANHRVVVLPDKDHITAMGDPAFAEALLQFLGEQTAARAPQPENSKGLRVADEAV